MANTIPLSSISGPVIQLNNDAYLQDGQYSPRNLNGIPCGDNALVDTINHWAIPIQDYGICTNFFFQPATGDYPPGTPPTPDSLLVLRVRDKYLPNWNFWVICTIDEYYASCAVCCTDDPILLPTPILPIIIPCQKLCEATNADGDYFVTFAAPPLGAGQHFQVYGQLNEEVLDPFEATDLNDLISKLNSNFDGGSPAPDIEWTRVDSTIIGTFQDGEGADDSFCLLINAIESSP